MSIREFVGHMAGRIAVAMAADPPALGPTLGTIGGTGTNHYAGLITEEYKTQLLGAEKWAVYERMGSDGQVTAVSEVVNLPARSAEWFVDPAKDITDGDGNTSSSPQATMVAQFIEQAMWTMPCTDWTQFIGEAIEGHQTGVALFEQSWIRRDGRIVWEEFGTRLPRTVDKWLTDDKGRFAGINQVIYGDRSIDVEIPAEKMIRLTFGQKGSNFEGRGWLRAAYKHHWFVELFEKVFAIAAERTGGGIPVLNLPEGANTSANRDEAAKLLKAWRVGQEVGPVLPHGFALTITDIKLPATLLLSIDHHNAMMARAALAGFLNLGKRGEGSYALSKSGQDLFLMALEAGVELIRDGVQKQAIKPLVGWNFGPGAPMPLLRYRINRADAIEQIEALEKATRARVIIPDDNIEKVIRDGMDLPEIDFDANRRESITVQSPPDDDPDGASETRRWPGQSVDKAYSPVYVVDDDGWLVDVSAPTVAGRARIGAPNLAQEFTNDPTRDGSGFWRALTQRERQVGFAQVNEGWDRFVAALESTIGIETDKAVASLLARMRRAMTQANVSELLAADFTATFESALRSAYREIGEEAVTWANKILSDGAGLPTSDLTAKERAWLRATWDQQLARWRQNVREEITRKVRRDPALRAEMESGAVGVTTMNRVLSESRANYERIKSGQLKATAKVAVGEGIHVGFNATIRDDRVSLVQRSEVLDANTCRNCRTLDGHVFDKETWPSVAPPHSCLGGSLCRGVGIPILATESPQPTVTPVESLPSLEQTRMSETGQ
ncbi:MAG: hypothetical protein GY937_22805 [bacterium]|nr:hypothetical protein [bacterium]